MHLAQIIITPPPNTQPFLFDYTTFVGAFFSRILLFAIIIAGIYFMGKLINAGFIYMTSIGEPPKIQAATKEIVNAAIGLALVISVFFIMQILETIFNIHILS